MDERELARMARFEEFYWWFRARRHLACCWLRWFVPGTRQVTDIGCGTGGTALALAGTYDYTGIDAAAAAVRFTRAAVQRAGGTNARLLRQDATRLGLRSGSQPLLAALDVLEHLEDDVAALREWRRVLTPDGRLLLTVPAYPFLWSEHDEALQHKRRYTMSELRRKLAIAGFSIEKNSYLITALLPVVLGFRFLRSLGQRPGRRQTDLVELPRPLNELLEWLCRVETRLTCWCNLPCGVSLVVLARAC